MKRLFRYIARLVQGTAAFKSAGRVLRYVNWPRVFVGYPGYRERMVRSLVAAAAIHAVLALVVLAMPRTPFVLASTPSRLPFVVNLQPDAEPSLFPPPAPPPPPQPEPLQYVDTVAPADAPVNPETDLIAIQASKARDTSDSNGEGAAPQVDVIGQSDELRGATQTPMPPPPPPQAPTQPEAKPEAPPAPDPAQADAAPKAPVQQALPTEAAQEAQAGPTPEQASTAVEAQGEAMKLAKAIEPTLPNLSPGKTQGRVDGGVKSKGFVSFEAMESEIAPYLKLVRDRVEKRWRGLMQVRYSGASETKAVMDCTISPDGRVVSVEIVEPGSSATYAALCKEAIERSGPFPAFPFKVPEMYRNENLEIRWTFSFL
ncbi:MAG: TonB C-terminal domain-containing protein [Candidatus Hydrogenedentes bacterium]|nr:TonB C-terminal domain-containing protein [Candidatus Hydrogenedentota bacterium]